MICDLQEKAKTNILSLNPISRSIYVYDSVFDSISVLIIAFLSIFVMFNTLISCILFMSYDRLREWNWSFVEGFHQRTQEIDNGKKRLTGLIEVKMLVIALNRGDYRVVQDAS